MNLSTLLPAFAHLPSIAGLPTSSGDLGEILRLVLCLALIIGAGSLAVALVDGSAARSAARGGDRRIARRLAALRSVIIRHLSIPKGK